MNTTIDRQTAEGILFTDQYQLTMAQLYFHMGLHERTVQFDHFFRSYPDYGSHQAGFCINAGLASLLGWMQTVRFREEDIAHLRGQKGRNGRLFHDDFLNWLQKHGSFASLTLNAMPEGRVVHPNVPLTVVQGPLAMAQILETPLLNHLNYPTLIATKAARIDQAGQGQTVLEFGMRRGPERAVNAGARAALIGGADFTSNTGLSHVLGLPPQGTHAHSMVQLFMALGDGELGAFRAYADLYPDDCLLLVDTINTLESGIPNAIKVFEELRRKGHNPVGIRLDSGDLAHLAVRSAKMLNKAGFPDTRIVLSNQLDEITILQILSQIREECVYQSMEADEVIGRLIYGVGTSLITSAGDAALDGVYKLVAVQKDGRWQPAIKISENPAKTPNPGHKQVWRVYDSRGNATADLLSRSDEDPRQMDPLQLQHPLEVGTNRLLTADQISEIEPLLHPVWQEGELASESPDLEEIRAQRKKDLARLDVGVRRLLNPHIYHVSLTSALWQLKQDLIASFKEEKTT
ncbi:MAG: nicotinate phosphoribosyltransferase [Anaerolineaceae bacterium]|nr:nicotinate phosphoribosyltransferase [Anaerolineaceae bacterium]